MRRRLRNHGLHPVQDRAGSHRSTHDRGISWRPSLIDRLASVAVRETVMHYRKSEVLCTENGKGHNGTAGCSKAGCRRRRVVGGRLRSVGYMWGSSFLGSSYDQAAPLHLPVWGKRWAAAGCVLSAPLLSAGILQGRSVLRYRPYTVSPSRITLRWGSVSGGVVD